MVGGGEGCKGVGCVSAVGGTEKKWEVMISFTWFYFAEITISTASQSRYPLLLYPLVRQSHIPLSMWRMVAAFRC